jgi:hypothetical protein
MLNISMQNIRLPSHGARPATTDVNYCTPCRQTTLLHHTRPLDCPEVRTSTDGQRAIRGADLGQREVEMR